MSLGNASVLDTIAHPDLTGSLGRVYRAVVEIQREVKTRRSNGETASEWVTEIVARATVARASVSSGENRLESLTVATATHVLNFPAYYPQIELTHRARIMTAVGGGENLIFNIVRINHDSQQRQTRLELEIVSH